VSGQALLPLETEPCLSCGDERFVEPFSEAMEPEPCPECQETRWMIWLRNPYGIDSRCRGCGARSAVERCYPCRARSRSAYFHEPIAVGQLRLPGVSL
jgi:hypothetical protein